MHSSLAAHQQRLRDCSRCPDMVGPVVTGQPVASKVLLVGQAPGAREGEFGRPFAWTAGRTLFQWFAGIGLDEEQFRRRVYMAAVCRCFPGKNPGGGDRPPNLEEIGHCAPWLQHELELLRPSLVLPVGKLAISRFKDCKRLTAVIGARHRIHPDQPGGLEFDLIPLPHPSGASTWHRTEPGRTLLQQALALIAEHPAWQQLRGAEEFSPQPGHKPVDKP